MLPPSAMRNDTTTLEALQKREAAIKAAIAAERIRQQQKQARLDARECSLIGEALVKYAGEAPDFRQMLKQVLASAVPDEASRKFLAGRGWL